MQYDHELDEDIISQIDKEGGKLTFNQLKEKTGTNSLTLSRHLTNLDNEGVIFRSSSPDNSLGDNNELVDERRIGKKRYCYLTKATRFEMEHSIFRGVKSKREQRNKIGSAGNRKERRIQQQQLLLSSGEKMNRLFQLLLLIAQRGALRYTKRSEGQEKPGDIRGYDLKEKRHFTYGVSTLPGIGESDFHADNIINVTDYRGVFGYLSPTERERKDLFRSLQSSNPRIIKQIEDDGGPHKEARYGLADDRLEGLISKILELFQYVSQALKAKWNYRRKPTTKEYVWYRMFYGDAKTRFFFEDLFKEGYLESNDDRRFSNLGPKWASLLKQDYLEQQKKNFSGNCKRAKEKKDEIEQDYKDLINKRSSPYSLTIRPMINGIYSPLNDEKSSK